MAPTWNKDYIYALGKSWALVRNELPSTPKRPSASEVTTTSLTLHWDPVPDPDIAGYKLTMVRKQSTNSTEDPPHKRHPHGRERVQLPFHLRRHWLRRLREVFADGDGHGRQFQRGESEVGGISGGERTDKPANVVATPGDGTITIRWTAPVVSANAIQGYYVERQEVAGGDFSKITGVFPVPKFLPDAAVVNGNTYSYRIYARDTSGRNSPPSDPPVSAVPRDTIPPAKLVDVFAEPGRGAGRVDLSWSRGADPETSRPTASIGQRLVKRYWPSRFQSSGTKVSYATTDTATPGIQPSSTSGNASAASDALSVHLRSTTVNSPQLSSAPLAFTVNFMGTTDPNSFTMEDDDMR